MDNETETTPLKVTAFLSFGNALDKFSHQDMDGPGVSASPLRRSPRVPKITETSPTSTTTIITPTKRTSSSSSKDRSPKKRKAPIVESPSASSSSSKKKKTSLKYASPDQYAHLREINDCLAENLICMFVGINPGVETSIQGHAYASPTNLFWPLLHSSGLTPDRKLRCHYDELLPSMYSLGTTNLVARPTRQASELSSQEMDDSVSILEKKVFEFRPESVCFVGKGIWESVYRTKTGAKLGKTFAFGWQSLRLGNIKKGNVAATNDDDDGVVKDEWTGARVFVTPSTSGLVAGYSRSFKENIFKELGDWVNERRSERGESVPKIPHPDDE
ncbi:hypothetical protein HDU97_008350 [Phlyctochytrium planicorne]|nr:hypothetical protein HDU97_008350 [Phlyctochytrium planicorne]